MRDWSWKQAVAERVLETVNLRLTLEFSLEDIYEFSSEFRNLFPRNGHVEAKIRQVLQRLRDDGFLTFQGKGIYSVNTQFEEIIAEEGIVASIGTEVPGTKKVVRNLRLRNTFLAAEIKKKYSNCCQVCKKSLPLGDRNYSEAHHLKPIGSPHFGPDVAGNIVVLCPNHHAMFDYGAATILPGTFEVRHRSAGVFRKGMLLYLARWHTLRTSCVEYHHQIIYGG